MRDFGSVVERRGVPPDRGRKSGRRAAHQDGHRSRPPPLHFCREIKFSLTFLFDSGCPFGYTIFIVSSEPKVRTGLLLFASRRGGNIMVRSRRPRRPGFTLVE